MNLWLFFVIFGLVLFVPTILLLLLLNRFKKTIVVLLKRNGALVKTVITDKILEIGQITQIRKKKIKPITVRKEEIYFGTWRRWIIKGELESTEKANITDKEIEEYLNNEDLLKLYLAGKFKDTLILLLGITIASVLIAGFINGYLTSTHLCILNQDNSTRDFIINNVRVAVQSLNLSKGIPLR